MGAGPGDVVGGGLVDVLKTELQVFETGIDEGGETLFPQADSRRNHVDVKPGSAGGGDQFGKVFAGERFSSSEMDVENAKLAGLVKDTLPVLGRKLIVGSLKLNRVGAVEAM